MPPGIHQRLQAALAANTDPTAASSTRPAPKRVSSLAIAPSESEPPTGRARIEDKRDSALPSDPPPPEPHPLPRRGGLKQRLGLSQPEGQAAERTLQLAGKRPRGEEEATPEEEYRHAVMKKFLLNKASAHQVKRDVERATKAGAKGSEDLARPAQMGNAHRSLMRAM